MSCRLTYSLTEYVSFLAQLERAVREGIIMQSCDGFGKRIYLRPVVQTELDFTEADRPF